MPKKVYWRFQQAMGLFSGVYQPGQSLKESLKQLNDNFPTKLGNADLLMQGLRHVFPGYTITPQEQAEAPQRREISATARTTMFTLIHNRQTEFSLKEEGLTFERGFDMLFDYSGSTSAKEWNDQVRYLFSKKGSEYPNGSKEQRGKMIAQFIDRLMNTDFDRLYHLSDRDLEKEFCQLYSLCTFLTEGGDALLKLEGDVYTLPDGYVDKVKELRAAHQTMIGSLRGRFEYIAQPEYEILPYERMRLAPEQFFDFYVEDLDAPSDWVPLHTLIDEDSHIRLFFD